MNYYPFHIGDYTTHTAHLEPMEDLAFRRLMDLYYLREAPLPVDPAECARLIRMKSQTAEVESVLKEFFLLTNEGWMNVRCAEELGKMKDKQNKAKASAQASVNARSTNAQRTLNERSTEVELPTPTPTPTPEIKKTSAIAPPVGVCDSVWQDFQKLRKDKKAKLTQTALDGISAEALSAGWTLEAALRECCARGWTGFKADWVKATDRQPAQQKTFAERDREAGWARWEEQTGRVHPDRAKADSGQVVDITPRTLEITQ